MSTTPQAVKSTSWSEAVAGALRLEQAAGRKNMQLLVQLRWMAVVGQIATIVAATFGLGIDLPWRHMLAVVAFLVGFNVLSLLRWRRRREAANGALFLALLVDVAALTAQLYLSGGTTNPFIFLYLLQVILGAVLLKAWSTWTIVGVTGACVAGLALLSKPLDLPLDHDHGLSSLYVQGLLICFALNAALLVIFIRRISSNLRARDAHLAHLRQREAEAEHIVRMGLLASGAAHELGTPLATMAVILGDWRHMPQFGQHAELLQEIDEMQTQVQRCKAIVSGILMSAGETRGESSTRTTIGEFLDRLVTEWRQTRPVVTLIYHNRFEHDLPMVSDSTLKQMIFNVMDNALEASPQWVGLEALHEADALSLVVTDNGPGFSEAVLAQFGKPYLSSKGRPGRGMGLFLAVNVARRLGGTVTAANRPGGGAVVRLTLPLEAITLEENTPHVG